MLVCMNCVRPIEFGPDGWTHRDPSPDCPGLIVAWPPPESDEADDTEDAA